MFVRVTTRKQITTVFTLVIFCVILMCAVIYRVSVTDEVLSVQNAADKQSRIKYIQNLGYTVNTSGEEQQKEVEIPYVFTDVFENYNLVQKKAGFDLDDFSGKKAVLYTYKLIYKQRDDTYAHLIVYENNIIGGDVSANSVSDGFILPLTKCE